MLKDWAFRGFARCFPRFLEGWVEFGGPLYEQGNWDDQVGNTVACQYLFQFLVFWGMVNLGLFSWASYLLVSVIALGKLATL